MEAAVAGELLVVAFSTRLLFIAELRVKITEPHILSLGNFEL